MAERKQRPAPHPDDLMAVSVALDFQAKFNPKADDPPPFDSMGFQTTLSAADAADYLESIVRAIRERRLYGFMVQSCAENPLVLANGSRRLPEKYSLKATATNWLDDSERDTYLWIYSVSACRFRLRISEPILSSTGRIFPIACALTSSSAWP